MHPLVIDLTGKRFGLWTVIERASSAPKGQARWLCRCECGAGRIIGSQCLRRGKSRSCGCGKARHIRERLSTHGLTRSPEYFAWRNMINRCENPKVKEFKWYGGRGIRICRRWRRGEEGSGGFECFLADVGLRPSPEHSLDRLDNDSGYEPGNVRWASGEDQQNNRRNNRRVVYRGQTMALRAAVRLAGDVVAFRLADGRVRRGWPVDEAVETPV